jgi:Glyoxalase/Bleomycin resistance protein/Dioxygenase superfamily
MDEVFSNHDSIVYQLGSTCINVLMRESAPELVTPMSIGPSEGGSRCLLTVMVQDVNAAHAELLERGVVFLNGPIDRLWGMRTAAFADPSGHCWEIAQTIIPPSIRSDSSDSAIPVAPISAQPST